MDTFTGTIFSDRVATYVDQIRRGSNTLHTLVNGTVKKGTVYWYWSADTIEVPPINCEQDSYTFVSPFGVGIGQTWQDLPSTKIEISSDGTVEVDFGRVDTITNQTPRTVRGAYGLGMDTGNTPTILDPSIFAVHGNTVCKPMAPGESILIFANLRYRTYNVQTYAISKAMKDITFDENNSAIFSIRPYETGLPIRMVRLNPNGFFTTNGSEAQLVIEVDCYLQFESFTPLNSPLPPLTGDLLIHDYNLQRKGRQELKRYKQMRLLAEKERTIIKPKV